MGDETREQWTSRLGVILAVAGSAIGLGNFLRFPVQAAKNGGGAFMIPYLVALLLLGIPLMWIEWTVGRYGGAFGHSTAPGMFHKLWRNPVIKYFGLIGIFGPVVIFIYYTYIESWTLGYAFFSLFGEYSQATDQGAMKDFLQSYQGLKGGHFSGLAVAYIFFLVTFLLNCWIVFRGITKGIEWLCKWAMPALFVIGIVLAVRVLTLGAPGSAHPEWNVANGLGFMWNPDFAALQDANVWLAAAGQIFFTLSVGIGVILTYASYLSRRDDVALSGLSAASANELAEVILGGTIVIPAAFAFFGPVEMQRIAQGSSFDLSFVTMPLIFQKIPLGALFGGLWFLLLFLAGVTSSISLAQPAVAFLTDELGITKRKAAYVFVVVTFLLCQPAIFFLGHDVLDELDFWGGTFCLVLFATIETILFGWFFGIDKAWAELHYGADIRIPRIYRYVIKYVTPLVLLAILGTWLFQRGSVELGRGDIKDWPGLCSKLRASNSPSPPAIASRLWGLLPPEARSAVADAADGTPLDKARQSAVVGALNDLLEKPGLFRGGDFGGLKDADKAKGLLEQITEATPGREVRRLNRLILVACYPGEVAGIRGNGIDAILMKGVSKDNFPYVLGARLMLVALFVGLGIALTIAWRRRRDIWDRTEAQP